MTKTTSPNIDVIMNPRTPSKEDVGRGFAMVTAVAEAIREAGEIPSGTLYAALTGRVLTWVLGPKLEAK